MVIHWTMTATWLRCPLLAVHSQQLTFNTADLSVYNSNELHQYKYSEKGKKPVQQDWKTTKHRLFGKKKGGGVELELPDSRRETLMTIFLGL